MRRAFRRSFTRCGLVCVTLVTVAIGTTISQAAEDRTTGKKLIEFGWDEPEPYRTLRVLGISTIGEIVRQNA